MGTGRAEQSHQSTCSGSMVPDDPEAAESNEAWKVLEQFDKPVLLAFADDDPVFAPMAGEFGERVPGCQGMPHQTIEPAGHFLQQDQPEQCVQAILDITGRS